MKIHLKDHTSRFILFIISCFAFITFSCNKEKPNVVFILTDQWRASAFGYAGDRVVKTPNIDQLANESVNFVNAVSVCPVSSPFRASLITGRYPTSTGMFLNDIYLPSEEICMAEIFRSAGYNTAYIGKWHLDGHGREENVDPERRQEFEYWKGNECSHDYNRMPYYENDVPVKKYRKGYSPFAESKDAQQYLEVHAKDKKPFLLFVSFDNQKDPYQLNNLVDKPEYSNLQNELENRLNEELEYIDDVDFKSRDFYLKKWGLELNEDHIIEYRSIPGKTNPVYTPKLHK
jgi:arylsulfatase A-like enzyme